MLKNKKVFITGAGGQLAKEFITRLDKEEINYAATDHSIMDICDFAQSEEIIREARPDILINCAAYNQVDAAEEDEQDEAFRVNAQAVSHLAEICKDNNIFLVHFSSDYIFDGTKNSPYTEEDKPNPANKYGESKLKGEKAVRGQLKDFLIFRLSWVIGGGHQNFLYKLLEWMKEKQNLKIVSNEISVPTFTADIIKIVFMALEKGLKGTYHLTNSGQCSRYELAKYYLGKKGIRNKIRPALASDILLKAKRPAFSCMSNKKISEALNISIPHWQDAVNKYVQAQE